MSLEEMEGFISSGAIELEEGEIVCIRSGEQAKDLSEDVSLYEFYEGKLRFQSGCLANPPI
jgi:hypothetical protein